jgi:four helix bundle protein
MSKRARNHRDLEVYQRAFDAAMQLHELSKAFPREEQYSLTDQMRRSSRSVCSNLAEAWRKRRYEAHFISKLSDAEAEAAEAQVWIEFAVKAGYLERAAAANLYRAYDRILGTLVGMINHPETWIIQKQS